MANVLIVLFLLIGLASVFEKVAAWFLTTKNISIIPATLIDTVAVIIFTLTYGSNYKNDPLWFGVSIVTMAIVIVINLIKHGIKNGILASLAELIFSISAMFLFLCLFLTGGKKEKSKKRQTTK